MSERSERKPRPLCNMYYVYVLRKLNKFYIGYTEDLKRRLKQHMSVGSTVLIYYESYLLKKSATRREKKLKHYGSAWRSLKKRITA